MFWLCFCKAGFFVCCFFLLLLWSWILSWLWILIPGLDWRAILSFHTWKQSKKVNFPDRVGQKCIHPFFVCSIKFTWIFLDTNISFFPLMDWKRFFFLSFFLLNITVYWPFGFTTLILKTVFRTQNLRNIEIEKLRLNFRNWCEIWKFWISNLKILSFQFQTITIHLKEK